MRCRNPHRTPAEIYCSAWAQMNAEVEFAIREDESFYLKSIALSSDDDVAALLLLKKLKLAKSPKDGDPAAVGMNSYVEFRFGSGDRRFCQLVHPTACNSSFAVSIGSRLGAGLIGLRAGQVLLWPDEEGSPRELHVIMVRNAGGSARAEPIS